MANNYYYAGKWPSRFSKLIKPNRQHGRNHVKTSAGTLHKVLRKACYAELLSSLCGTREPRGVWKCKKVAEDIFIGSCPTVSDKQKLKDIGITDVLCAHEFDASEMEIRMYHKLKISHFAVKINLRRRTDATRPFKSTNEIIERAILLGGKILVCSTPGTSYTSAACVAAYLMTNEGITGYSALELIHAHYNVIYSEDYFTLLADLDNHLRRARPFPPVPTPIGYRAMESAEILKISVRNERRLIFEEMKEWTEIERKIFKHKLKGAKKEKKEGESLE